MNKRLREQLRSLKQEHASLRPSQNWVVSHKERLLTQIKNTVTEEQQVPVLVRVQHVVSSMFSTQRVLAFRGAFAVVLVVGLATSGLVASASPLPRDLLFNVKVAMVTVTGNAKAKGKLHLDEANYQAQELQRKVATGSSEQKDVEKQLKKIKKQVDSAKKTLDNAQEADRTVLAKDLTKETTTIAQSLKEVTDGAATTDATVKEVTAVRQDVLLAGIDGLVVLGELIDQPTDSLGAQEVTEIQQVVEEKIVVILEEAEAIKQQVIEDTKVIVSEQQSTTTLQAVIGSTTPAMSDTTASSTSNNVSSTPVSVQQQVEKDIQTLSESAQKTDTAVTQVKELLGENQVGKAVEAVKQLQTIAQETEAVLINVREVIKTNTEPSTTATLPAATTTVISPTTTLPAPATTL